MQELRGTLHVSWEPGSALSSSLRSLDVQETSMLIQSLVPSTSTTSTSPPAGLSNPTTLALSVPKRRIALIFYSYGPSATATYPYEYSFDNPGGVARRHLPKKGANRILCLLRKDYE